MTMIEMKRRVLAVAVIAIGMLAVDAGAQGKSQGKGKGGSESGGAAVSVAVVFRDSDPVTFRNYFATHKVTAQALPPGIAKNVARGKPLPPGIAKKALPAGLLERGPRVDKDVSFAIVGEVVVALKGGVVIDVLAGVFK